MAATYVRGSGLARDQVRNLIRDTDVNTPVYHDEEIDDFLAFPGVGGNIYLAAAAALEAEATDQVRLLKVITMFDLKTDGAAVAKALLTNADRYRQLAATGMGDEAGSFTWAELILTPWQAREAYANSLLRGGL